MDFLKKRLLGLRRFFFKNFVRRRKISAPPSLYEYASRHLHRPVILEFFLPPSYDPGISRSFPTLLFNDGQDLAAVGLAATLDRLYAQGKLQEIIVVGIYAGDRLQEYGTAGRPDYQGRGAKAAAYGRFVTRELLPFLRRNYCSAPPFAVAGFSLGGLSAFDLAWNHSRLFHWAGVFSGSFWWRHKTFKASDPDAHRIAQEMVERAWNRRPLRFWFQTGTCDETSDRNNNGVIDAIDDTLDLIGALKKLGYQQGHDIKYVEVIGGEHNPGTWGKVMPDFLLWAFGK